jgi:hypothetical protein
MKRIKVKKYNLERDPKRLTKEFGTIKRGEEEKYSQILYTIESNLLKLYRQDKKRDSTEALDAINMALLYINSYINELEYDFSLVANDRNTALCEGIKMAYDPYENSEIYDIIHTDYNLDSIEGKKAYFATPAKSLLRIKDSVEMWMEKRGSNGYFDFLEGQIGNLVPRDDNEINFAISVKGVG